MDEDAARPIPLPDGAWCIDGHYGGDLVTWAEEAGIEQPDLDGDCVLEEMPDEFTGLGDLEAEVDVTAEQEVLAGEIVQTTTTSFELVDPPVCVPDPEPDPGPDPGPNDPPEPEPSAPG